jgi:predicted MFS family arabinose efflux permease
VPPPGWRALCADARLILAVQALRAFAYGAGAVLVGVSLDHDHLSGPAVGAILAGLLVGSALASVLLGRFGDTVGRRRCYRVLLIVLAVSGTVFALTSWPPALLLAALTGTISPDVVESGPFTSLEQAMLPHAVAGDPVRVFGTYNTVATLAGSLGALAAAAPSRLHAIAPALGSSQRWLLVYPVCALAALPLAARLSARVDAEPGTGPAGRPLRRSRTIVRRMAGLFALDSFGGGFVVQTFISYWLARRFGASPDLLGVVFFAVGILQAASFMIAVRIAGRIGLLRTMVFTHLPSNVLLAAVAFAPNLATAIALLLARFGLSQMDVPPRQAYVVAVVTPEERTAAAAYTNSGRYAVRPIAPLVTGGLLGAAFVGAPFLIAGTLKSAYDLGFYALFRRVPVTSAASSE